MKKRWLVLMLIFFFVGCGKEPTLIQDHQEVSIPQSEKSKAYYQYLLGEHAVLRGFYGDAIEYFNHADKIASSTAIEYRIAVEHARHMRFRESFDVIDRILEKEPQHFYAKLLRAKIYATEGNYIDSKQDFKDVLADPQMEADPQEKVRTQLSLVTLQIEAKDFVAARKLLAKMEKEDPQNELVYYYQARILTEQGRLQEAQRLFEKTVQINDQFSLAHRALVLMYEYHDQEAKKIATLEKIVALQPTDIQVRTQLIRIYIAKGQFKSAKKHEEYFANRFEQNINFCYELGLFYIQQKMFAAGNQAFESCASIYPDNDQILYYYALSLFYTGKPQKSLEIFGLVKPESEFFEKSILARASILSELQTHAEIVSVFEQGMQKKPESSEIRLHFARYQFEQKHPLEAKKILRKATRKFEQDEPLLLLLAEIYEKEKAYVEMEEALRKILEFNPASASALNFLGYSYADQGVKLDEAEQLVVRALEIKPTDGYIQDSLSWVYYKQKKYKQALQVIETALQTVKNEWVIWSHYGDILDKIGKKDKALQAYQKALELSKETDDKNNIQQKINLYTSR